MNVKTYYECRITMEGRQAFLEPLVKATGWKFSAIDGDPTLGYGVKCYATMHYNAKRSEFEVLGLLNKTADRLIAERWNESSTTTEVRPYAATVFALNAISRI